MRRSHHKILKKNIVEDKKSGEYKLSHHVDLKTGFYNGKKNFRFIEIFFMSGKIKIAIDAMGGENAPDKIIDGISKFVENNKSDDYKLLLYGDANRI